jgi:hypothetical protein
MHTMLLSHRISYIEPLKIQARRCKPVALFVLFITCPWGVNSIMDAVPVLYFCSLTMNRYDSIITLKLQVTTLSSVNIPKKKGCRHHKRMDYYYSESKKASSCCALCFARAFTDILAFAPSVSSARWLVPKTFLGNEDQLRTIEYVTNAPRPPCQESLDLLLRCSTRGPFEEVYNVLPK